MLLYEDDDVLARPIPIPDEQSSHVMHRRLHEVPRDRIVAMVRDLRASSLSPGTFRTAEMCVPPLPPMKKAS